jgi:glutamate carboxypeptidase
MSSSSSSVPSLAEIRRHFEARRTELLELLIDLVSRDSPTGDLEASRGFVGHYRRLLEACGVACREHAGSGGVHLAGDWPGDAGGDPDVLISVHSDTVWPRGEAARRPPSLGDDGRLFGPGALDMRAGLTIALEFFRFVDARRVRGARRYRIFVSADEERGSLDARRFMDLEASAPLALVLEPPLADGSLKAYRKGVGIYDLEIRGRAAHAGTDPERGASAIDELARQIDALNSLRDPSKGITINVGTVRGGTASNVIADFAEASIDLRFEDAADGDRLDARIRGLSPAIAGTRVAVRGGLIFAPMAPTAKTLVQIERARALAAALGMTAMGAGRSGGGSDGSYLSSKGITVLDGIGVDGGGAHSLSEHVLVERLPLRAALLAALAMGLAPGSGQ